MKGVSKISLAGIQLFSARLTVTKLTARSNLRPEQANPVFGDLVSLQGPCARHSISVHLGDGQCGNGLCKR